MLENYVDYIRVVLSSVRMLIVNCVCVHAMAEKGEQKLKSDVRAVLSSMNIVVYSVHLKSVTTYQRIANEPQPK